MNITLNRCGFFKHKLYLLGLYVSVFFMCVSESLIGFRNGLVLTGILINVSSVWSFCRDKHCVCHSVTNLFYMASIWRKKVTHNAYIWLKCVTLISHHWFKKWIGVNLKPCSNYVCAINGLRHDLVLTDIWVNLSSIWSFCRPKHVCYKPILYSFHLK